MITAEGAESVMIGNAPCVHCGLPVRIASTRTGEVEPFCCEGCRTVHGLLLARGLDRYYAIRAGTASTAVPARTTDRSYAELDDAALQAAFSRERADGLIETDLVLERVHCAACVWLVERLPRLCAGVAEARLDLPRARALVTWDPHAVRLSEIARILDSIGYAPHPARGAAASEIRRREDRDLLMRIGVSGGIAANVMAIAFALYGGILHGMESEHEAVFRWASLVLTIPAMLYGGEVFFRGAWGSLRARVLHIDVPISLGILAGFAHGAFNTLRSTGSVYFDSVTALIFLLLVGRFIQQRRQRVAGDAAELLASLSPTAARRVDGGEVREVPVATLLPGMAVEIRAGETVPIDGVIREGASSLDVSLLTGESRPLRVEPGTRVHAGTLNLSSRVVLEVESTGEGTRLGRLMRLVDEHMRRKAPLVQLADRISGWFVAAVVALAALTLAMWWRTGPAQAIDHAIALLIVSCPCALGLATPLAFSAAIGQAARGGILIKGADALERLASRGRIWLDKTGTLTEGRLGVIEWAGADDVLEDVTALELHSAHPIALAFARDFGEADPRIAVDVLETRGAGIEGICRGRRVVVGSAAFVEAGSRAVPAEIRERVEAWTRSGSTPVLISAGGMVVAAAALGDRLRPDVASALARIRALGWRPGVLSGDHPVAVAAIGRKLGIEPEATRGGVTPEEKLAEMTRPCGLAPVVMVGDGVNDAAALAAADVGIAVHGGAEAALLAADVFIRRPGVGPVADLLEGAVRTMRVVRRNLALSLVYNLVGISLAMMGMINPIVAAILMPVSSLTVIGNSYRSRMFRFEEGPPCP